jgi:hypothetical protein
MRVALARTFRRCLIACDSHRTLPRGSRARGAVAVEFILTCLVFFFSIFVLIELGNAVCHYAILQHLVSRVSREVAIDVGGEVDEAGLSRRAETRAVEYIRDSFGMNPDPYTFRASVVPVGALRYLQIDAERKHTCIACGYLPPTLHLRTQGSALIEDLCFSN